MRRIFGKSKGPAPPGPTLDQVSTNVGTRASTIDEKVRKLDIELAKHKDAIAKARPGPAKEAAKQRAMRVLRQKKMYQQQADQLYSQQFNMDQMSFTAQNMKETATQVKAMAAASRDLQKQFKSPEMNIGNIERMHDDMADLMDQANEIQDLLSQEYNVPDDIDDEELLSELDALELDMQMEAETGDVPSYLQEDLPDVPAEGEALPQAPDGSQAESSQPQALPMDEFGMPVSDK
mmetsp:Transcript_16407/g.19677  ORF Transcript_16407/g.19677 Transcript_16407/m.19677 type:complete len:235 (-) Transcript_16407:323-1027(-)|eukprot:CAMPEP_0197863548 /NCGR_PEP_ID=MMETSP1438-20131217/41072_1 /TAXON_ID=1461541 /ORGANISM="Pterosperma sp., Strain CCMP1384" /LENGTH=234 /DNA_ID=CAMNT_0043481483 /DNA_START=269 /DNA_END=973 /DNA_ORIENTATION=+